VSLSVRSETEPAWLTVFPKLAEITDAAWHTARLATTVFAFPPGTVLMRPGDPIQGLMLLARGTVRVLERAENGREIVLYRAHAGELCILSLTHLFNLHSYVAEVISEDNVEIVSIPTIDFQNAFAHSAAFRQVIMCTLARRLSDLMHLVGQVTFQRLDLRLACLLGQLFGERGATRLSVTHQGLARELGTTREVTSRLLKEFERLGCIRLHRGSIELLSPHDLARLSDVKVV
jgi:CRP/FNR family transcriptional regulator